MESGQYGQEGGRPPDCSTKCSVIGETIATAMNTINDSFDNEMLMSEISEEELEVHYNSNKNPSSIMSEVDVIKNRLLHKYKKHTRISAISDSKDKKNSNKNKTIKEDNKLKIMNKVIGKSATKLRRTENIIHTVGNNNNDTASKITNNSDISNYNNSNGTSNERNTMVSNIVNINQNTEANRNSQELSSVMQFDECDKDLSETTTYANNEEMTNENISAGSSNTEINDQNDKMLHDFHELDNVMQFDNCGEDSSKITKHNDKENEMMPDNYEQDKVRYDSYDKGPYIIYVESYNKNIGRLHPMALGKKIHDAWPNMKTNLEEIGVIGKNKVKLILSNGVTANRLLDGDFFKSNNLRAYIPKYLTVRTGIIFDVDSELSEEEIVDVIESEYPIVGVKCIRSKKENHKTYKSQCVKLTFKGTKLPEKVAIHSVKCPVTPFVKKVIQCHKCWRFGHVRDQCRGEVRCPKCAENHALQDCINTDDLRCCLCFGKHAAYNRECPIFMKYKKIYEIMATQNLAFHEARSVVENNKYARITRGSLTNLDKEKNFPVISTESRKSLQINNNILRNKFEILSDLEDNNDEPVSASTSILYSTSTRPFKRNIAKKQERTKYNNIINRKEDKSKGESSERNRVHTDREGFREKYRVSTRNEVDNKDKEKEVDTIKNVNEEHTDEFLNLFIKLVKKHYKPNNKDINKMLREVMNRIGSEGDVDNNKRN
ncbi:uncharacterized protein LOC113389234 [Ctenocephalides felis]|uniref:uncharacterized protein LOC113389234 n=1 Tax=Ctenocephalides felis TaxID=7515 RepID=UPI000E6E25B1|nr:uncharacterized protein LOC113389234 [Ctenocephalides felis]